MQTYIRPTHHQIAELLIDDIISEMTQFLMDDYGYSLEQALHTIYTSHLLVMLQDEDAELYVQSPSYNYELLLKEKGLYPVFDQPTANMVAEAGS